MDDTDDPRERIDVYLDAALRAAVSGHEPAGLSAADLPAECRAAVGELHQQVLAPLAATLAEHGVGDPVAVAGLVQGVVRAAAGQVEHGRPYDEALASTRHFVHSALGLTLR